MRLPILVFRWVVESPASKKAGGLANAARAFSVDSVSNGIQRHDVTSNKAVVALMMLLIIEHMKSKNSQSRLTIGLE